VITLPATQRLIQVFERELRERNAADGTRDESKRRKRVSGELDREVIEFVAQVRTTGRSPEQMLVELKGLLSRVAPEVSSSHRNELMSSVTGRAIDVFFGKSAESNKR
jgi:hypothetical protein